MAANNTQSVTGCTRERGARAFVSTTQRQIYIYGDKQKWKSTNNMHAKGQKRQWQQQLQQQQLRYRPSLRSMFCCC